MFRRYMYLDVLGKFLFLFSFVQKYFLALVKKKKKKKKKSLMKTFFLAKTMTIPCETPFLKNVYFYMPYH